MSNAIFSYRFWIFLIGFFCFTQTFGQNIRLSFIITDAGAYEIPDATVSLDQKKFKK
jgi:hypothetical protein